MTLKEMKIKVLSMIEEIDLDTEALTSDPDIEQKLHSVINQVIFELARFKKIPDYIELEVSEGDTLTFEDIKDENGYEVYQIDAVSGVEYEFKARGTVIKVLENGVLEIEYFRYPTRITDETNENKYVFELSDDALEVAVYGICADLLKSDISAQYGNIYAERYEALKNTLDSRYNMGMFTIEGGVSSL